MHKNILVVNIDTSVVPTPGASQQQITVDATVKQFNAFNAKTTHVYISVDTNNVRVTFDGSAPSTTAGHLLTAPFTATWSAVKARSAKFIRTGSDANLVGTEQCLP